ncbi:unnamed protein product, partial [Aureobasidium uvarum]
VLGTIGVSYLLTVAYLRNQRKHQKHQQYDHKSLSELTLAQAQEIQLYIFELEFPFLAQKALEFALFRTYGIPSISSLLMQTKQLSTKQHASKRMVDTAILMMEVIINPPASDRSAEALARTNFLHSLYGGKISNEDLLYTLSLFLLEPIRWIERFEWRQLTEMEIAAMGLFWLKVGQGMRIDFSCLPGEKSGWKDGLQFTRELEAWCDEYEEKYMVPAQSNKDTADCTTELLLYAVPAAYKDAGRRVVSALMDKRLRRAMLNVAMASRRRSCHSQVALTPLHSPKAIGMAQANYREYRQRKRQNLQTDLGSRALPSFANRWCLQSWTDWLAGRPIPGDEGDKYFPQGFKSSVMGPAFLAGKGLAQAEKDEEQIRETMRPGVTIAG